MRQYDAILVKLAGRTRPDEEALTDPWGHRTYRELDERVTRLGSVLVERGVRPGDRVAVLLPAHWQTAAILLGAWSAALVVSTVVSTEVGTGADGAAAAFASGDRVPEAAGAGRGFAQGARHVHIPDGYLSPVVALGSGLVTVPVWAIATQKVKKVLDEAQASVMKVSERQTMQGVVAGQGRMLAADLPAALLPHLSSRVSVRHVLLDGLDAETHGQVISYRLSSSGSGVPHRPALLCAWRAPRARARGPAAWCCCRTACSRSAPMRANRTSA